MNKEFQVQNKIHKKVAEVSYSYYTERFLSEIEGMDLTLDEIVKYMRERWAWYCQWN